MSQVSFVNLLVGFGLAAVVSLAAWRAHALNRQGALAATALGTVIFGIGGLPWAILLLAFFISSSLLSRVFGKKKQALDATFSKGGQRDAAQVAANGGIAGLMVLAHMVWPSAEWVWPAYAGALAAANADTWATELGVLSRSVPRMITTWKPVERGTSGGITLPGTLASLSGAALIALLAVLFPNGEIGGAAVSSQNAILFAAIALAGLGGSLLDSLLGATLQAIYWCPACQKETERHPLHTCGTPTHLLRGLPWVDNDLVNVLCTLAGAILAAILS